MEIGPIRNLNWIFSHEISDKMGHFFGGEKNPYAKAYPLPKSLGRDHFTETKAMSHSMGCMTGWTLPSTMFAHETEKVGSVRRKPVQCCHMQSLLL